MKCVCLVGLNEGLSWSCLHLNAAWSIRKISKAFIYITYKNVNYFCKIKFSSSLLNPKRLIKYSATDNIIEQWDCLNKNCPVCCSVPPQVICSLCFRIAHSFLASAESIYFHIAEMQHRKALEYLFIACVSFIVWRWFVWSGSRPCVCQCCSGLRSWPFPMKESVGFLLKIIEGNYFSCGFGPSLGEKQTLGWNVCFAPLS